MENYLNKGRKPDFKLRNLSVPRQPRQLWGAEALVWGSPGWQAPPPPPGLTPPRCSLLVTPESVWSPDSGKSGRAKLLHYAPPRPSSRALAELALAGPSTEGTCSSAHMAAQNQNVKNGKDTGDPLVPRPVWQDGQGEQRSREGSTKGGKG